MTTTVEFRTPEETALQLEVLLLGTLTSRNFPAGPIPALPISDVKLSREIRKLSDRIHELSTHGEDGIGVIGAVTAARRALASTWIAATIAGKRPVTLVDADLRSAHLSFDQGTYAQEGLVDVLRYGVRSPRVVAPTQVPGVSLLPVGSGTVDLSGTWASSAVEPLLRELARSGDFLVINGPGIEDLEDAGPFLDRISMWMLLHEIGSSDPDETLRIRNRIGVDKILGVLVLHPEGAAEPVSTQEDLREVLKARTAPSEPTERAGSVRRGGKRTGLFAVAGAATLAAALLIPRLFSQESNESLSDSAPVEEPWTADEPAAQPKQEVSDGVVEPLASAPMLTHSSPNPSSPGNENPSTISPADKTVSTPPATTGPMTNESATTNRVPASASSGNATGSATPANPPVSKSLSSNPQQPKPEPSKSAPEQSSTKPASGPASYGVHVSSMQTEVKAKEEAARFVKAGYPAFVRRVDLGEKGIWHRVYAGPYDDRAAADRAAQEVRARGLTDYTLVQRISGRSSASGS